MTRIKEVEQGLWRADELPETNSTRIGFSGPTSFVYAGEGCLTKVCLLLGVSNPSELDVERGKLKALSALPNPPDMVTDLSIVRTDPPLYSIVLEELGCPTGTIPVYYVFDPVKGIEPSSLFAVYERQVRSGCSFFTLHCTPNRALIKSAIERRRLPTTSRGGGLVMRDLVINNRSRNVFDLIKHDLAALFRESNSVISVASSFRAAATPEALDETQLLEIEAQGEWVKFFLGENVQVMLEGPGHCPIQKLEKYASLTKRRFGVPMMDLGPMATDVGAGLDHVSAAAGLAVFGLFGGVDVINPITRHEHTGGVPSREAILEALFTAQIVGHAIDMAKLGFSEPDEEVYRVRSSNETCVVGEPVLSGGLKADADIKRACDRCRWTCPLVIQDELVRGSTD